MAYIDEAFLQDAFGSAQVTALCPTADELTATIELAEAEVHSAVVMGGYQSSAPGDYTPSTVPKVIKLAAYGAWLELAHLRMRKELPDSARAYTHKIELIRKGDLEIIGSDGVSVSKDTGRAVNGIQATDSTSTGRPTIFGRTSMEGY